MSAFIQDAGGAQNMAELLDSVKPMQPLRRGDVIEGVVMRSDPEGILLNIGHKAEGVIPPGEMKTLDSEGLEQINIGDEIVALVVKGETTEDSAILLSIDQAVGETGWRTLAKALESGELVGGKILGFNRGGAIIEVEGVQGFVPMSQLVTVSRDNFRERRDQGEAADADGAKGEGDQQEESSDIGRELHLKVLEVNRGRNRAILSERQALQEQREKRKARLIQELTEGEVRRGRVTGVSSFGAFVDLGGADGLIHISELSWSTVRSPDEMLKIGQEVDVYVLRVDAENKKIALSLKRLQQEPWETISERHRVGDLVNATVTKLTNFGAFARVEGSVEGLIHISELASRTINHPGDVVRVGDSVRLKILRIEPERRRLGLSLREAEEEEQAEGLQDTAVEQTEDEEKEAEIEQTAGLQDTAVEQAGDEEKEAEIEQAEGLQDTAVEQTKDEKKEAEIEQAEGLQDTAVEQTEES